MLAQVPLGAGVRFEVVEDVAAAAEARRVAAAAAGEHDRRSGFPPGAVAGVEPHPDLAAGARVARVDLDRQVEHRSDPERVDRAHRLHQVCVVDQDAVAARSARERVGDDDRALLIRMDEVLAGESRERIGWLEPEAGRMVADRVAIGRGRVREPLEDPAIEGALRLVEPTRPVGAAPIGWDRSRLECGLDGGGVRFRRRHPECVPKAREVALAADACNDPRLQ